jgi:hypothetical protein
MLMGVAPVQAQKGDRSLVDTGVFGGCNVSAKSFGVYVSNAAPPCDSGGNLHAEKIRCGDGTPRRIAPAPILYSNLSYVEYRMYIVLCT